MNTGFMQNSATKPSRCQTILYSHEVRDAAPNVQTTARCLLYQPRTTALVAAPDMLLASAVKKKSRTNVPLNTPSMSRRDHALPTALTSGQLC